MTSDLDDDIYACADDPQEYPACEDEGNEDNEPVMVNQMIRETITACPSGTFLDL